MRKGDLGWKVVCLEHDDPSAAIANLILKLWPEKAERKKIKKEVYIRKEDLKKELSNITTFDKRVLFTLGYGELHHYTYGFATNFADKLSKKWAYLHFDNHPDYPSASKLMNCGRFVKSLVKDSKNATEPLLIGCEPNNINRVRQIRGWHPFQNNELEEHLSELPIDVYLSFDLDVLHPELICTGYSRGYMDMNTLMSYLRIIKDRKNIIGADIIGSSFKGDIQGHFIYSLIASFICDLDADNLFGKMKEYPKMIINSFDLEKYFAKSQ
ncbi:arginase family protein [Candidatus Woesearchaeota archaeon]|nr:arginase family protein [Candidatus Woesearchaeota archaeon]